MKFNVKIDPQAKKDINEICIYIAVNDSLDQSINVLDRLEASILKLQEFPTRGHIPPELRSTGIKKYLEIHYKPYRIIYEIEGRIVYVHAILDGRRNVNEILQDRLLR